MRRNKSTAATLSISKDLNTTSLTTNAADLTSIVDTSASNLVIDQENKIRNLLKELQNLVKNCEVSF